MDRSHRDATVLLLAGAALAAAQAAITLELSTLALAAVGALLSVWSYRERSVGVAVAAATLVALTVGALGMSTLLALAALGTLLFSRHLRRPAASGV